MTISTASAAALAVRREIADARAHRADDRRAVDRRAPRPHRRGQPRCQRAHGRVRTTVRAPSPPTSTRRLDAGEDVGPLAGVPFCVKENIDLTWSATTSGWTFLADAVPTADATMVRTAHGCRRHSDRPRQHARLGPALGHRQRPVRPHLQSVGPVPRARGLQRRRRGRRRDRHGAARPRQRLRRVAAAAGIRRRVCALRPSAGRIPAPMAEMPSRCRCRCSSSPSTARSRGASTTSTPRSPSCTVPTAATRPPSRCRIPPSYDGPRRVAVVRDPLGWGVDPQVAAAVDRAAGRSPHAGWTDRRRRAAADRGGRDAVAPHLDHRDGRRLPARCAAGAAVARFDPVLPRQRRETSARVGRGVRRRLGYRRSSRPRGRAFQQQYPIVLGPVSARRMPPIGYDLSGPAATTSSGATTGCW